MARKASSAGAGCFAIIFAVGLLCYGADKCWQSCTGFTSDRSQQNFAELQQQQEQAQAEREDRQRAAAQKAEEDRKAAIDQDERDLSTVTRTARIRSLLRDGGVDAICAAKRLLSKATFPDGAPLHDAKVAIKAAERKQLLSERADFEQSRSVVCVDGSGSSCSCHGSHSGCCSHHGGVAGCEPYPTEVSCPSLY